VPDAATAAAINRLAPTRPAGAQPGVAATTANPGSTATPASVNGADDPATRERESGSESAPDKIDPTALAKLLGTPGPGSQPGGAALPTLKGSPNRGVPTPTLNTSPGQSRIDALRSTKVSFVAAYKQALGKVEQVQSSPKLAFASANILRPERTAWSFLFLAPDGNKMWRVIFDSTGPKLDINEQAPSMQADASIINMEKVLDSEELLRKAESGGLKLNLPVDIFNFQVEGVSRQPCFVLTNVTQGKQVAINAYTGAVVRDDFTK